jgi:HAD superfamily hydrolase (TIGR01509 family)
MYIIRGRNYSEDQIQEMMDRKNRYYNDMIKGMTPNDLVPGGRQLLQEIRNAGIKVAIASGSKNAQIVLDLLDITSYLDGVADGYCIVNSKPAPDLFVYAAGLVNVHTVDCLGVEDADAGIEAIKTAGMQALAIGPEERFHRADKVLPTLANKSLQDILA